MRVATALLVSSLAFAQAAFAQAPCSIQTITGTYAVQTTGWSASGRVIDSPLGPAYESAAARPCWLGRSPLPPDGTGGHYWGST